ncbi:hypothetical protein SAY86_025316 [Trapa natans]|uniref:Uncharacterized protein n=1 Tax=Trapa natans TaxID=22666 RepID=A0AAN7RIV1_TRANT|nr:hypothetical protein SAY86_025316 [Trapa natans]
MQQFRYNDIQVLQQHLMLKQQQEMQRQQHPLQPCDTTRQNSSNHPSIATKQVLGDVAQLHVVNRTTLNDASRLLTDWDSHGASPSVQGLENHLSPSIEQSQDEHLTGFFPHRVGASIYGNPFPSTRDNVGRSDQLRGISLEAANLADKIVNPQQPLSVLQSSALGAPLVREQVALSSEQVCIHESSYTAIQGYIGENIYEPQLESDCVGSLPGALQAESVMQMSKSVQEFIWKRDQGGWPGDMQQKPALPVPLDPLEKKFLYNSEDNACDASFGKYSSTVSGGSGNIFEPMDTCSSLYSGSWSALMQSAVAETSSGETKLTEEWSGSTYQNPDSSTENQPPVMDGGKLNTGWVATSFQSLSSLTSSPYPGFHNSGKDPSMPIFQLSSIQSLSNQNDELHQAVSPETIEKLVTNAIEWLNRYSVQKSSFHGNQQIHPLSHLNAWSASNNECTENAKTPLATPLYDEARQSFGQEKGENKGVLYQFPNVSNALRNANSTYTVDDWRSSGGLDQSDSDASIPILTRQDSKMDNFTCNQNSSIERFQQVVTQHMQAHNQPKIMSRVDVPLHDWENVNIEKNSYEITSARILNYPFKVSNEIYPEDVMDKVTGLEHRHINASEIDMNLAKDSACYGGNSKISEGIASIIDPQSNKSSPFDGSAGSHAVNITVQSVAEKEWAQATNRVIEKLEGELEKIKYDWPKLQARRRLLLSTHLMQQLLRSPPASMLSVDASLTYDSLTYSVAQVMIGNACSPTDIHKSDPCRATDSSNRIHENVEAFERSDDNYFTKAVENFISRAKKLEEDLLRLEQAATFLDINVTNQELERYSVINRFANFHIGGHVNSSKMLPSQGAALSVPRVPPQRYITIHSLPEMLPEGVKCLSL